MTYTKNPAFPIHENNYKMWKDKSLDELYTLQTDLLNKMAKLDHHHAASIYEEYDGLMYQLDLMIEAKSRAQEEKEKANDKYNERRD